MKEGTGEQQDRTDQASAKLEKATNYLWVKHNNKWVANKDDCKFEVHQIQFFFMYNGKSTI